jgi:uncharacterized protein YdaU (DUF1376 family)
MHLTLLEHGCYRQLLDQYYLNEEPLPLDLTRLFRLINARTDDEQIAIKNIIADFFTETESGFIHSRCDLEIQYFHARLDTAIKAGKASAEKRAKANERSTSVQRSFNQPITNNLITNNQLNTIVQNDFDLFWNNYPKKTGKEAARKSFNKIRPNIEVVLKALEWQKRSEQWFKNGGQFIPNPATWINQHRWNDEPPERVTF